jgi:hypothetical protein
LAIGAIGTAKRHLNLKFQYGSRVALWSESKREFLLPVTFGFRERHYKIGLHLEKLSSELWKMNWDEQRKSRSVKTRNSVKCSRNTQDGDDLSNVAEIPTVN